MKKFLLALSTVILTACVTINVTPDYTQLAAQIVPSNVTLIGNFTNPWTGVQYIDREYCSGVQLENKRILTAGHCVAVPEGRFDGKVKVRLPNGKVFLAKVVKAVLKDSEEKGMARDAALLEIDEELPHPAKLGSSEGLKVGQQIAIVGNSYGLLEHSFSVGEISFVDRILGGFKFIQSTAAAAGGNSGGGVYNMKGELIGLLTHGVSDSYTLTQRIESILAQLEEVQGDVVEVRKVRRVY